MNSIFHHRIIVRTSSESFPIITTLSIMYKLDSIIISYAKGCYDISFCSNGCNPLFIGHLRRIVTHTYFSSSYTILENVDLS